MTSSYDERRYDKLDSKCMLIINKLRETDFIWDKNYVELYQFFEVLDGIYKFTNILCGYNQLKFDVSIPSMLEINYNLDIKYGEDLDYYNNGAQFIAKILLDDVHVMSVMFGDDKLSATAILNYLFPIDKVREAKLMVLI
jgi:hypothetical protein